MPYKTIIDLLIEELAEIRTLEEQFVALLPKMMAVTQDAALRHAFLAYQDRAILFLDYFDQMTEILKIPRDAGKNCALRVSFGQNLEALFTDCSHHAVDAALIGMALKTESYLGAAYLNACVHARMLGLEDLCDIMKSRLKSNFPPSDRTFEKTVLFAPEPAGEAGAKEDPLVSASVAG